MTKRVITEGTGIYWLIFMFYIVSPLFGIINLIAIFESLSIMKILWQILKNAVTVYFKSLGEEDDKITKFSIYDFNNKYNCYFMFFEEAKNDTFDFNLVMFTAFLGDLLMQSRGFRVSTAVFSLMNALSFILVLSFSFLDYDKDDNKYTILNILYLLFCYILLFLGVGASALLSQQIIIDSNGKYNEYSVYLKKLYEDSKELSEELKEIREEQKKEKEQFNKQNEYLSLPEKISKEIEFRKHLLTEIDEWLKEKEENNNNKNKNENNYIYDSEMIYLPMLEDMIRSKKEEVIEDEEEKGKKDEKGKEKQKQKEEEKEKGKEEEKKKEMKKKRMIKIAFPLKSPKVDIILTIQ